MLPAMEDLTESRSRRILEQGDVARIGVISDGEPYVTPLSYVVDGDLVLFRSGPGRRLDAIRADPRVCLEVSTFDRDTGGWEGIVAFGDARILDEGDEVRAAERMLREKYRRITRSAVLYEPSQSPEEGYVVEVRIDDLSGRSSGSGIGPRTRPGRL
jgi:uncharacterized protein